MPDHGMKKSSLFAAFVFACPALAASEAHFVFNHAAGDSGSIAVSDSASFEREKGYGFEPLGAAVDAAARCMGPASPTVDPIVTSDATKRFSVSL